MNRLRLIMETGYVVSIFYCAGRSFELFFVRNECKCSSHDRLLTAKGEDLRGRIRIHRLFANSL
jgi:hypothetical protein